MEAYFEVLEISYIEIVAVGTSIRDRPRLQKCMANDDGVNLKVLLEFDLGVEEYGSPSYTGMKQPELESEK